MIRDEDQCEESEIVVDYPDGDYDDEEDDDADTIEEEPDFSCGSNEELFSDSADDTATEDEEAQMKNRMYTHIKTFISNNFIREVLILHAHVCV